MIFGKKLSYFLLILIISACQRDNINTEIPLNFKIEGTASGRIPLESGSYLDIDCVCETEYALEGEQTAQGDTIFIKGKMGGSIRRRVLNSDGDGLSFWPHMGGNVLVKFFGNQIVIGPQEDSSTDDFSPFYKEIIFFKGIKDGTTFSGKWNCAPLETRGDEFGTVNGTWFLIE